MEKVFGIRVRDIVEATSGTLLCGDEDAAIRDICINSKEIKEGDLFVPIIGAKVDAHRFIESALEVGAATLTSQHTGIVVSEKPYIYVSDTVKALQDIGAYIRSKLHMPIIGVTGSVGKTTTREMIAWALSQNEEVFKTIGNMNSQIGMPVTISRIPKTAKAAVLEMGMSEFGQMHTLSEIARPDICVVTVIGVAHMEFLKTKENIRHEKLSIVDGMKEGGILFLNGDDDMLAEVRDKTGVKTFCYGTKEWCEYRAENIRTEDYKLTYEYVHGNIRVPVKLNVLGRHNVSNSLVAMAISDYLGYNLEKAAKGFESFDGVRQKLITVPGKYTIIDDTYNASPDSMKASIDVLSELETNGRKIAVLGDMFELGENSEKYHYDVGKYLADKHIDELAIVGELSQHIMKAVQDSESKIACYPFNDNGEVALYLMSVMKPEDVVLIKGSNGMNMNEIVKNLLG